MSIKVDLNALTDEQRKRIPRELQFKPLETEYGSQKKPIYAYSHNGSEVFLPLSYSVKELRLKRPPRDFYPAEKVSEFEGKLRPLQKEVRTEILKLLSKSGSCILSLYCGAGKTMLSVYLANQIGFKTLVIVHRLVLIKQWKETIAKVFPSAKVQVLSPKSELDPSAKFYIINALNVSKMGADYFKSIGTCIVDEVHVIATEKLSKSLTCVTPRYLIGLSATPTRPDGMGVLLDVYFGKKKVHRKLQRNHTVFRYDTGFVPEVTYQRNGKVDWNSVLESQASSLTRNYLIIDIIRYFKNRYFLILCKRVKQGEFLIEKLKEAGEDVTSLLGKQVEYDQKSRILVATIQKCGVGFDHPKLNTLIMAGDAKQYYIQFLGRVLRREDGEPWVFELIDDFGILKSHYYSRKKIYLDHGGVIKDFKKEFSNFNIV